MEEAQKLYERFKQYKLECAGTLILDWEALDSGEKLAWHMLADDVELFESTPDAAA